ncbi:MAG: hypothetical protein GY810_11780 [Aureispira sp.]|nr:hypothetical protein [Aureispira sp.]
MRLFPLLLLLSSVLFWTSCQTTKPFSANGQEAMYTQSIVDASYPEADEISKSLTSIATTNKSLEWKEIDGQQYVLTATWVANKSYYPTSGAYNTKQYDVWVTAIPDLSTLWPQIAPKDSKNNELRLKQLLGLPPTVTKSYFIEFWVQPKDLFRPCPDKDTEDSSCELCFTDDSDSTHIQWIRNLRNDSYYNCSGDKYPWTQLGYTYDWNPKNKTHVGLSEFVIKNNSSIFVNKVYTTEEYLNKK